MYGQGTRSSWNKVGVNPRRILDLMLELDLQLPQKLHLTSG